MMIFLLGPVVLAVVAIVVAIRLFSDPEGATTNTTTRKVLGALCLLLALGIGTCCGVVLSRAPFW